MRLTPQQENARTLALLMGLEEEEAAQRLKLRTAVTFDASNKTDRSLAEHVMHMLNRTVDRAGPQDGCQCAAELVIGRATPSRAAPVTLYAGQVGADFAVGTAVGPLNSLADIPEQLIVIAACYAAGAAVRAAIGPSFPIGSDDVIVLRWNELFGPDLSWLRLPLSIDETYLAGAGAVGNGFIYTLRYFDVEGILHITDPKKVTAGGLNRCLLVKELDIGHPKASRLSSQLQAAFPHLQLVSHEMTLAAARKERGADFIIDRLVVAADSRGVRRSLQSELPRAVFDASTTDVREVVLHFNRQPTELACLSCVYPVNERERTHEENVARALGITVEEAASGLITPATADKVQRLYPDLPLTDLVGRASDTLYKELCAVAKLKADEAQQVAAPFSFVSTLAGAHLAIEFALRCRGGADARFNYWRLSPWHNPVTALRQVRPRESLCEFCGNPIIRRQLARLFP